MLNQEKYYCGIFVDLQKAFDAVGHNVLLGKLKHFIRGIAYSWSKSYFKERKQYLSIKGFNSKNLPISHVISSNTARFIIFQVPLIFCILRRLLLWKLY